MAQWPRWIKALVLKTSVALFTVGSNPTCVAISPVRPTEEDTRLRISESGFESLTGDFVNLVM